MKEYYIYDKEKFLELSKMQYKENKKEKLKLKIGLNTCKCGKEFEILDKEYSYKDNKRAYCSWSCYRKYGQL